MKVKLVRLDKYLAGNGFAESRTAAQEYIEQGRVTVNGSVVVKPASQVMPGASVKLDRPEKEWVSRGAYKLLKAVEYFGLNPAGLRCIDIGASTGGFTDVLLSKGAASVCAVDVGYGQLAWKLRNDDRVLVMERTNARFLTAETFENELFDLLVCDASFISLKLLLNVFEQLIKPEGTIVTLVKPQFEVGREHIGRGVVTDPALHEAVLKDVSEFAENETGLKILDMTYSPIRGPEGNIEFLLLLAKKENTAEQKPFNEAELVAEAHKHAERHI